MVETDQAGRRQEVQSGRLTGGDECEHKETKGKLRNKTQESKE